MTGREFRETGPAAHPCRGLGLLPERKQLLGGWQQPVELHRRRRGIARGELRPGGEPDALLHRREAVAVLDIDHRTSEGSVPSRPIVPVIAALEAERQLDAERRKHIGGKRPERHHRLRGIDRPLGGLNPPAPICAVKRARIPAHHHAPECGEARGKSLGHRERIGDAGDALPMDRMAEDRREARLDLARGLGVECAVGNAELLRQRQLTLERAKTAVATIELEPAFLAQIAERARFRQQRFVLRHRARKQRAHHAGGVDQAPGGRCSKKLEQPRCDLRQEGQVIIGLRGAFERDPQQGHGVRGKGRRKHGVAFDRAGVAVGGLLARRAPIEQRNGQATLRQMQSNRGADNAGTKHEGIDACHGIPFQRQRGACAPARTFGGECRRALYMGLRSRARQAAQFDLAWFEQPAMRVAPSRLPC